MPGTRSLATLALLSLGLTLVVGACRRVESTRAGDVVSADVPIAPEVVVTRLPLAGAAASRENEMSGMTWANDQLVLLPQYPDASGLFTLTRQEIVAALDDALAGRAGSPLRPHALPIEGVSRVRELVPGFQGFEAIVIVDRRVYLTIESSGPEVGYLVTGALTDGVDRVTLDPASVVPLAAQAKIHNTGYETLAATPDGLIALYERNASTRNPGAKVRVMTRDADGGVTLASARAMTPVEYRVTDATSIDSAGKFWVINYRFPPSEQGKSPTVDELAERYGLGETHAASEVVERLLELQLTDAGVTLVEAPPIVLELGSASRNWEGLVRLDDRGFLLVTDKFPTTVLGFVPFTGG
jgi:hypothetical protein